MDPVFLATSADACFARFEIRHDPRDLERAIARLTRSIEVLPAESAVLEVVEVKLAWAHRLRFYRSFNEGDLRIALRKVERWVPRAPAERPGPDTMKALATYGILLSDLYHLSEDPQYAVRALAAFDQAKAASGDSGGNPDLDLSRAVLLIDRGAAAAELADIDAAIEIADSVAAEAEDGSPVHTRALSQLGVAYRHRYLIAGERADIDSAVEFLLMASSAAAAVGVDLERYCTQGATCLGERGIDFAERGDLDRSIQLLSGLLTKAFPPADKWPLDYQLGQSDSVTLIGEALAQGYLARADAAEDGEADLQAAFATVESLKSRFLTRLLSVDAAAPAGVEKELLAKEREIADGLGELDRQELVNVSGRIGGARAGALAADERDRLALELERTWSLIAESSPEGAEYVAARSGRGQSWAQIHALAAELGPETAILSLHTTERGSYALAWRADFDRIAVSRSANLNLEELFRVHDLLRREVIGSAGRSGRNETWHRLLVELLQPLAEHLNGSERVVTVPSAYHSWIPWPVVFDRAGLVSADGTDMPVVIVPALDLLAVLRRPAEDGGGRGAMIVADPTGDLDFSAEEAAAVAEVLGGEVISATATAAVVGEALTQVSHAHFATHADFASPDSLLSSIRLRDGGLTARDLLELETDLELLVLSGCETGRAGAIAGQEGTGLAEAFLIAGARSAIVSRWRVADSAAASLMREFYRALAVDGDAAAALRTAMTAVREDGAHAHPYYWAAFDLIGDWAIEGLAA
ncbi:MAG TPA: CHAT domain-containing protein [Solirubrobacterales bacterium]|nr:CHAT domain-containing protein [Solirubrobacterales bacterium]